MKQSGKFSASAASCCVYIVGYLFHTLVCSQTAVYTDILTQFTYLSLAHADFIDVFGPPFAFQKVYSVCRFFLPLFCQF